jgi:hypothetical protein
MDAQSPAGIAAYSVYLNGGHLQPGDAEKLAAGNEESKARGAAAYKAYVAGKTPSQVTAAKKLYVAWLTMVDGMGAGRTDPNDLQSTPAGRAYAQAWNEFKVDSVSP